MAAAIPGSSAGEGPLNAAAARAAAHFEPGRLGDGESWIDGDTWICGAPERRERPRLSAERFTPSAADGVTPWMAKLDIVERVRANGATAVSNCGAVAVASNWLLTAAHCVGQQDWLSVRATLGSRDVRSEQAVRRVGEVALCHRRFDPETLESDLALLRLSEPLPGNFPFARLASEPEQARLAAGTLALSAGWGRVSEAKVSSEMRRSLVRIVEPVRPQDGMIVAAPNRHEGSLCVGESGAPLLADLGGGLRLLGVFSSVDAYRDPETGDLVELCHGYEARSYFTAVAGLRRWIAGAIASCERDLARCVGRAP